MRQGTGYAYGDGEDYISYKCEGCGQRVRVTPAQARQFRGAFTACSRVCVLKARDLRTQQARLLMGMPEPAAGDVLGPEAGAVQERQDEPDNAGECTTPQRPAPGLSGLAGEAPTVPSGSDP
ncbi:MAG TPA: hypothetical protein VIH59_15815 [Candidatus Tectomicrobia bacterium]|jgi:hypothetical protein